MPTEDTHIKSMDEIARARTGRSPARGTRLPEAPPRRPPRSSAAAGDWREAVAQMEELKTDPAPPRAPARTSQGAGRSSMVDPEDVFRDAKVFVAGLNTADKLAVAGAALNVLFAFMPWKETAADGEVLGLMSLGGVVFLLSLLTIAAVVVRVQALMPRLNPLAPWLLQLVTACFCLVWCLIYVKLSWNAQLVRSPIGNVEVPVSRPAFGVFVSVCTSLVALAGTLMGLRERPR